MIPDPILAAVTRDTGGGLALILGAGCSLEPPTDLKVASYYASDGYRRLVANGLVPANSDLHDDDLAAVASHCVEYAGRDALRELLPIAPFLTAESNPGTQIVMALMREDIVRMVITLNLDLSATHALTQVSSKSDIVVISRQDRHSDYGARNLVYLHGNVSEQPEHWVLTKEDLELAEESGWLQLMALLATAAPVTLFAGMGSEANVFANSVQWIAQHFQSEQTAVYLASRDDGPISDFATSLNIDEAHYIKRGWCDLMRAIGRRVCEEMIVDLLQSALTVQQETGWEHEHVECAGLEQPLARLGLVGLGQLRAAWLGEESRYLPQRTLSREDLNRFSELLVLTAAVALHLGVEPKFSSFGSIQFPERAHVLMRSGGGRKWATLEDRVRREYRSAPDAHLLPRKAILAHARNRPADARVPVDIVDGSGQPNDIAVCDTDVVLLVYDDVLADPGLVA